VTVVTDAEVALLEDAEPSVELQNTRLAVAEKLSLEREPYLTCGRHWFLNDLMEFRGEGAENPCHHDVGQSSLIDGRVGDVEEDVVVQGVWMRCEKHEVVPPIVVGRRGF
jgi:hypothetical protein